MYNDKKGDSMTKYEVKVPLKRRIWAFITALATTLSFLTPELNLIPTVSAASIGYTVDFSFLDHTGTGELPDEYADILEDGQKSLTDGYHYVMVTAENKAKGWTTYALKKVDNYESVQIDKSYFRVDQYNNAGIFTGNDYNDQEFWGQHYYQGHYDLDNGYSVANDFSNYHVRLLLLKEEYRNGFDDQWVPYSYNGQCSGTLYNKTQEEVLSYFDSHDSNPDGFAFAGTTGDNYSADIKLKQSKYEIYLQPQITFGDSEPYDFTPDVNGVDGDGLYVVIKVHHVSGATWWWKELDTTGVDTTEDIVVDYWRKANGSDKADDQKFPEDGEVEIKLITKSGDKENEPFNFNSAKDAFESEGGYSNGYAVVEFAKGYKVTSEYITEVEDQDDSEKIRSLMPSWFSQRSRQMLQVIIPCKQYLAKLSTMVLLPIQWNKADIVRRICCKSI